MTSERYKNLLKKGIAEFSPGPDEDRRHGNARTLQRRYRRRLRKTHKSIKDAIKSGLSNADVLDSTWNQHEPKLSSQVNVKML